MRNHTPKIFVNIDGIVGFYANKCNILNFGQTGLLSPTVISYILKKFKFVILRIIVSIFALKPI